METRLDTRLKFYRHRIGLMAHLFNREFPLPYYFGLMIGRKCTEIRIADLGSGPICQLGGLWDRKRVVIVPSDVLQPHYQEMLDARGIELLIPTEHQDMMNLTYPDESFDIVHCVNAMDHVEDAEQALREAVRICRPEGHIYLRHALAQKRRWGGHHFWNVDKDGSFGNGRVTFRLQGFRSFYDGHHVISIMRKRTP